MQGLDLVPISQRLLRRFEAHLSYQGHGLGVHWLAKFHEKRHSSSLWQRSMLGRQTRHQSTPEMLLRAWADARGHQVSGSERSFTQSARLYIEAIDCLDHTGGRSVYLGYGGISYPPFLQT